MKQFFYLAVFALRHISMTKSTWIKKIIYNLKKIYHFVKMLKKEDIFERNKHKKMSNLMEC